MCAGGCCVGCAVGRGVGGVGGGGSGVSVFIFPWLVECVNECELFAAIDAS